LFELSTIFRYLIPKKGEMSSSLISLLSLFIITLVTWLTLVFLSVADGIEQGWVQKLTNIHGKVKVVPNQKYFDSYYYRIDSYKFSSGYTTKNLKEKIDAPVIDFSLNDLDEELPDDFPSPVFDVNQKPINLVQNLFAALEEVKKLTPSMRGDVYDISPAMMRIKIFDRQSGNYQLVSQAAYVMSSEHLKPNFLPSNTQSNTAHVGVYLPKSFETMGAKVHDVGQFSVLNPFSLGGHEETIPFEVVGFYTSGTLQIGPKCIFAPYTFVTKLKHTHGTESADSHLSSGISIDFDGNEDSAVVTKNIEKFLSKYSIQAYFDVIPYTEFSFVKDIFISFQTDRLLYFVISIFILAVASSNIVCVLLMIVFQSRKQIALYSALGASNRSIIKIFAGLGFLLGTIGAVFGLLFAVVTMRYLPFIIENIQIFRGYQNLFSDLIPSTLSMFSVRIVLLGTPILGCIAGFFPALKASRYRPSELLRGV
jgi:lipoprotein-releasing system permease protein